MYFSQLYETKWYGWEFFAESLGLMGSFQEIKAATSIG